MTAPGGTSRTTVALAPIRASSPTVTGPTTTAPAPIRTRCWKAQDICAVESPALVDRGQGHPSACHFAEARTVVPVGAE